MGVPIQKENEASFGPEVRGENGEEVSPFSSDIGVWESVVSSPSGVPGVAPADSR